MRNQSKPKFHYSHPDSQIFWVNNAYNNFFYDTLSARFAQTERDERRIWSVNEYFSSFGKEIVISKISHACINAFW